MPLKTYEDWSKFDYTAIEEEDDWRQRSVERKEEGTMKLQRDHVYLKGQERILANKRNRVCFFFSFFFFFKC